VSREDRLFPINYIMGGCRSFDRDPSEALNIYYGLLKKADSRLRETQNKPPVALEKKESFRVRDAMRIEAVELFGLMPSADNYVAKYIMLSHEIVRVHMFTRKDDPKNPVVFLPTDYRNA
jgi:hypothetical protein